MKKNININVTVLPCLQFPSNIELYDKSLENIHPKNTILWPIVNQTNLILVKANLADKSFNVFNINTNLEGTLLSYICAILTQKLGLTISDYE